MKKVIFLCAIALIAIGCQQKQEEQNLSPNTVDAKLGLLIKKEVERIRKGCNDIVLIDFDKILPPANLEQWKIENEKYFCTKELGPLTLGCYNEACSNNIQKIDIQLIKDKTNDEDEEANNIQRAKWLKDNGGYICFGATYPHFKETHEITSNALRDLMIQFPNYEISYANLKTEINQQANVKFKTVGVNYFDTDAYQIYARITVKDRAVKVKVIDEYEVESSFSIPFLRSIKTHFCTTEIPDPSLVVEVYPFVSNGNFCTGFKVRKDPVGTGPVYFLNYSTDPK